MTPKSNKRLNELSGEEAKLVLDSVLQRYRIPQSGHPERTEGKTMTLAARKPERKEPLPEQMAPEFTLANRPLATARQSEIGPCLELGWRPYFLDTSTRTNVHLSNERARGEAFASKPGAELAPTKSHDFHYLIRILECSSILHCQVIAESAAAARDQLEQIPNLIEWREITAKELAEIIRIEKVAGKIDDKWL